MKKRITYVFVLLSTIIFAQNWTGNINSDWNNPQNWSVAPGNGDNITIDPINYTGVGASPIISVNSNFSPAAMLVQNGAILSIEANLTTEDDVEIINLGSKVILSNGNFNVNVANGGRLIADLGGQIEVNGGNLHVGERLISGAESIITFNGGTSTTDQRLLMDLGGKIILNNGVVNVNGVMALADGELTNSCYFEQNGGQINVTGEVALENEAGNFEPTIQINNGDFTINGDLVWFGMAPGSGTPKFLVDGGTVSLNGNLTNMAGSTVDVYLKVQDAGVFNFNGASIDLIHTTDSIIQVNNSGINFSTTTSFNNAGVFHSSNSTVGVNGNLSLNGTGVYQFNTAIINGTLNHVSPMEISVSADFNVSGNFIANSNRVVFNGILAQNISGNSPIIFNELTINNTLSDVNLQQEVNIVAVLNLMNGRINSSSSSLLYVLDNAIANANNNSSFVNGPMVKKGDDHFAFPVGKASQMRIIEMSNPQSTNSQYMAEYFDVAYSALIPINLPIYSVSNIEHWLLTPIFSNDVMNITLHWSDATAQQINNCNTLTMANWDGSAWNQVAGNITGSCANNDAGFITSTNPISTFGPFTFASTGIQTTQNLTICQGQSITVGANTYNATGTYTDILVATDLSDSTVITNLTVQAPYLLNQTVSICDGETYAVGTNVYTAAGTYTDQLQSFAGCDSTIVTTLIVNTPATFTQNLSICEGESIIVGTSVYSVSGTFTDVLSTVHNCDSTVTTVLEVIPPIINTSDLTLCFGDSLVIGTNVYKTTGFYIDTLPAFSGCDSIVSVNLTINPIDFTLSFDGVNTLTSNQSNVSYQWVNCETNEVITGATTQSFVITSNGSYGVIITDGTCTYDTTECFVMNSLGINKLVYNLPIVYPNPVSDKLSIMLNSTHATFSLFSVLGQEILVTKLLSKENTIQIEKLEVGTYIYKIEADGVKYQGKLVKD